MPAEWELIEWYVAKYLKHEIVKTPADLVEKMKAAIIKQNKNLNERQEKMATFCYKYVKCLLKFGESIPALEFFMKYLREEDMNEYAIDAGFKFFEEKKDPISAVSFFKEVVGKNGFVYSPKFVANALRMCTQFGVSGITIVESLKDAIFNNHELSSPFAINMIIVSYGNAESWDKLHEFVSKVKKSGYKVNKYTAPTIKKFTEKCYNPLYKGKIIEIANSLV